MTDISSLRKPLVRAYKDFTFPKLVKNQQLTEMDKVLVKAMKCGDDLKGYQEAYELLGRIATKNCGK